MALIKCSECGKGISDKATFCPSCGHPAREIKSTNININNKRFEVELTNKKWKIFGLTGLILAFLGLFAFMNSRGDVGIIFLLLGFIIIFLYRVGRWWTNG